MRIKEKEELIILIIGILRSEERPPSNRENLAQKGNNRWALVFSNRLK